MGHPVCASVDDEDRGGSPGRRAHGTDTAAEHDFDVLFRAEGDRLYQTLYAFTGGRADIAEEATAEAFARAVAHSRELRDPLAWMYRVAFRVVTDEFRRERRQSPGEPVAIVPPPEMSEHVLLFSTGGDEGYSGWVACEGCPTIRSWS